MKKDNKKEIKKSVMAGAGTVAGAVIGTVVENALNPAAAEAEDKEEPEVLEAVVEEEIEAITSVEDSNTANEAPVMNTEATYTSSSPAKRPTHTVNVETSGHETETVEPTDELESVSLTATELQPEVVMTEEDTDDDIPVVTIEMNANDSNEDLTDDTVEAVTVYDSDEPVDYAGLDDTESKANGDALGDASIDMPDYVNNANIDSFTDPA